MSKTNKWVRIFSSPTIVVLVISVALIIINLYITQYTRPYISDDVSWQTTLLTWLPFNGHIADVGATDNFLINAPMLALFDHLFTPSRTIIFTEASIYAVCNFLLFYYAAIYFMRKSKVELSYASLAPFLWLSSFGYAFASLFLNLAWRDFEVGVAFIYFMLAIKLYYDEISPFASWRSKAFTGLAVLVAGLEIYSDPYFLYFVVVPIILLYAVLFIYKKISKRSLAFVVACATAALVVARLLVTVMAHAGLFSPKAVDKQGALYNLRNIHTLIASVHQAFVDMLIIFGSNTLGLRIAGFTLAAVLLNLLIFTLIVLLACWAVYRAFRSKRTLITGKRVDPTFLVAMFFIGLSVFAVAANTAYDPETYRYLIIMVYSTVIVLALIISRLYQIKYAISVLILVATVANIGWAATNMTVPKQKVDANVANNADYKIIENVKQLGITKGYASYWDGNINTYLSGGRIKFLPVTCISTTTKPLKLLVDATLFNQSSNKTFYIYDPTEVPSSMCTESEVKTQFGNPAETVYAQGRTIFVYDYDIESKM